MNISNGQISWIIPIVAAIGNQTVGKALDPALKPFVWVPVLVIAYVVGVTLSVRNYRVGKSTFNSSMVLHSRVGMALNGFILLAMATGMVLAFSVR